MPTSSSQQYSWVEVSRFCHSREQVWKVTNSNPSGWTRKVGPSACETTESVCARIVQSFGSGAFSVKSKQEQSTSLATVRFYSQFMNRAQPLTIGPALAFRRGCAALSSAALVEQTPGDGLSLRRSALRECSGLGA